MIIIISILVTALIMALYYKIRINYILKKVKEIKNGISEIYVEIFENIVAFLNMINIAIFINFEDIDRTVKYKTYGSDIIITEGIVIEKNKYDKNTIIDNIIRLKQNKNDIKINTSDSIVKDYHYVKIIAKHNSKEYIIDNKDLFINTETNDIVFLTIAGNNVLNVSFKERIAI